jgi:hypothetical protein
LFQSFHSISLSLLCHSSFKIALVLIFFHESFGSLKLSVQLIKDLPVVSLCLEPLTD